MEAADIIVVNKSDGDLLPLARHTQADYRSSIRYMRPKHRSWPVRRVMMASAMTGEGLNDVLQAVNEYYDTVTAPIDSSGKTPLEIKRSQQSLYWFQQHFGRQLSHAIHSQFASSGRAFDNTIQTEDLDTLRSVRNMMHESHLQFPQSIHRYRESLERLVAHGHLVPRVAAHCLLSTVFECMRSS